jgi:hypothetical protein
MRKIPNTEHWPVLRRIEKQDLRRRLASVLGARLHPTTGLLRMEQQGKLSYSPMDADYRIYVLGSGDR